MNKMCILQLGGGQALAKKIGLLSEKLRNIGLYMTFQCVFQGKYAKYEDNPYVCFKCVHFHEGGSSLG